MRDQVDHHDPMKDPSTRVLLREAACRLSAGYVAVGDEDQANRWAKIAEVMSRPSTPPLMAYS